MNDGINEEANTFRTFHIEADDRIMFFINQICLGNSNSCAITVISPDAKIFVTLLYHLKNSWLGLEIYLMKKGRVKTDSIVRNELYPLHHPIGKVNPTSINCLPAGHALKHLLGVILLQRWV